MDESIFLKEQRKFINKDPYELKTPEQKKSHLSDQSEFRKFIESQGEHNNLIDDEEDLVTKENLNSDLLLSSSDIYSTNSIQLGSQQNDDLSRAYREQLRISSLEKRRYVREIVTNIDVHSSDRDLTLYPNPETYKIQLKKSFSNIISVKLKSTEFENTQQLIRDTGINVNNLIFWSNADDDISANNLAIYVTALDPGNYNEITLASEIENKMNAVQRTTGAFHNFDVSIDTITDEVTFTSVEFQFIANPFSFVIPTENFTTIEVALTDHGLFVGDRVIIDGAVTVGGIDASVLNNEHVVSEASNDDIFEIQVASIATSNETDVGGTSVSIGVGLLFQLLWSRDDTVATILGFEEVDTELALSHTNTTEDFKYFDEFGEGIRLTINKIDQETEGNDFSVITTTLPHLLSDGDRIFLFSEVTLAETSTIIDYNHLYGSDSITLGLDDDEENQRLKYVADLANPAGLLVTIISDNKFYVPIDYESIVKIEVQRDAETTIGDEDFGDIIIRTRDTTLNLGGEKYIFMCNNLLKNIETTGDVTDAFYKIQLSGTSNDTIFNSYIGSGKIFFDFPLNELNELEFSFKTRDNESFDFQDKDHSFTLEIVEARQILENSLFPAKIGAKA